MWLGTHKKRRQRVRQQLEKEVGSWRTRLTAQLLSWRVAAGAVLVAAVVGAALMGEGALPFSIGQRTSQPVHARVDFEVPDSAQTAADRQAARASTPSYYSLNAEALSFGRIRADLMRVYQAAAASETFDAFHEVLAETGWPVDPRVYQTLHALAGEEGHEYLQKLVDALPLESEYVVGDLLGEPREPKSTERIIRLEIPVEGETVQPLDIPHTQLVLQGNDRARRGSARQVARQIPLPELASIIEAIVYAAFADQPTVVFNRDRTLEEMHKAEIATPIATTPYEAGDVLIGSDMIIEQTALELLQAEHTAYQHFLQSSAPTAAAARRSRWLQLAGTVTLIALLTIGVVVYTTQHLGRVFAVRSRTLTFMMLIASCVLAARLLYFNWPEIPELVYAPCLLAAGILVIVYPRRFATGVMSIVAVIVTVTVHGDVMFLIVLFAGLAAAGHELAEIRSRTKLISTGVKTAMAMTLVSLASGLADGHAQEEFIQHSLWAGGSALGAAFILSGILPFIERIFRVATSLTLLEWRDPTRPLLQLLAREAPGTYNHSLVVGTLAEAACESIGTNGLLAQVGALYHDIGKIPKADYFAENQGGQISRHENLAPTMSLLIILGHVKDGAEMAKEYRLPGVLHQFIEEHHGTTVVRYFHHVASEKQPQIASGKHDRKVSEAEFRYAGPKPRIRESAVLMMADGVEGAVRALAEPTPGRIESVVHQVVTDRLADGQFDDCDITLRELHSVEESLVKSLCAIYNGRVAYPKSQKDAQTQEPENERRAQRMSI